LTALEIATEGAQKASESIRAYDFQQAGRLNEAHVQALTALHEGLMRGLSLALGNHLNATAEVKLAGMEELPFLQLISQLPPNPYVSSLEFQSQQSLGALQIDLSLAFPALDLVLGGTGAPQPVTRGLSEIEISLMEDISTLVVAELEEAWKPVDISVSSGSYQKPAELRRLLPPDERVLVLRFQFKLNESEGGLNVFVPIGTAAAMLRKLSTMTIAPSRAGAPTAGQKIQERLLDCVCSMELSVSGIKVSVQDVLSLAPGKLLDLGIPISAPAVVSLEGHEWFDASPVRAGSFRAAKLANPVKKRLGNG
jgi:flagellar motor switch protein FliM